MTIGDDLFVHFFIPFFTVVFFFFYSIGRYNILYTYIYLYKSFKYGDDDIVHVILYISSLFRNSWPDSCMCETHNKMGPKWNTHSLLTKDKDGTFEIFIRYRYRIVRTW